ncbi:MAG: hypothetical protein AB2A00_14485 [Myxococcota bacterium]
MANASPKYVPSWMAQSKVLLFAAAGLPLGVPIEDMLRLVPEEDVLPMPLAHPALAGVMPSLEGVSPVFDLALLTPEASRRAPARKSEALVALFPHSEGSVGIRLERLAGLVPDVDPMSDALQAGLLSALPSGLRSFITSAATAKGQLFFFFSKDAFLAWVAAGGVEGP